MSQSDKRSAGTQDRREDVDSRPNEVTVTEADARTSPDLQRLRRFAAAAHIPLTVRVDSLQRWHFSLSLPFPYYIASHNKKRGYKGL